MRIIHDSYNELLFYIFFPAAVLQSTECKIGGNRNGNGKRISAYLLNGPWVYEYVLFIDLRI